MKKIAILLITLTWWMPQPGSVFAQSESTPMGDYAAEALCVPGIYSGDQNCLALGASETLKNLSETGMEYPLKGLPAYALDEDASKMPFRYAKLNVDPTKQVNTFPSLDAAVANQGASGYIPPGATRYIAYTGTVDVNGGHYVELAESGEWVRASPSDYSRFRGLVFWRTPENDFGWLVDVGRSRTGPGLEYPETGLSYPRDTLMQVYETAQANQTTWYRIGIHEWMERRVMRVVTVNTDAPEGVNGNRWIEVNLYEQTLSVYENGQLAYAALVATGMDPFFTRPGLFQIREKKETETMTGAFTADKSDYYYFEQVPWTMYFDGSRALHAAYWRTLFGYEASHGCVNLAPADAHWLFDWAAVGDWVYVWDPSGQTPTDPSLYTDGGA